MIKLISNDKEFDLPVRWEEVSYGMYLKLLDCDHKIVNRLSALIGVEFSSKDKIKDSEAIIRAISFLNTIPIFDDAPTKLGAYEIPKDITWESIAQFEKMREEIEKTDPSDSKEQVKIYGLLCAIYLQKLKDGEFDFEKAQYLAQRFLDEGCLEVISLGRFFYAKVWSTILNIETSYLLESSPKKKQKLALKSSIRLLGSMPLWTLLQGMWANLRRKFSFGAQENSSLNKSGSRGEIIHKKSTQEY